MSPTDLDVDVFILRNPVSALTHLFWCVWALFMTLLLWKLARGDRLRRWAGLAFGLSMVLLYGASGVYHALCVPEGTLRYFRLLDHSAIYVLIAGTYTPVCLMVLRRWGGRLLLWLIWALAGLGIAGRCLLAAPPYPVTVALYVGMGWLGALPAVRLVQLLGWRAMGWCLLGGLLYTVGGVCDAVEWPVLLPRVVTYHEVSHLLDMGGTAAHVVFIVRYVLPFRPAVLAATPLLTAVPA
jgi:hemolysin III